MSSLVNITSDHMVESTDDHMASDPNSITRFADSEPVKAVSLGASLDSTRYFSAYGDASLSEWYSRPVELLNTSWVLGGSLSTSLDPWNVYFNNPSVKRKMSNYTFFSAKMHVKVLINGSSFHYGKLSVSYLPLDLVNAQHWPLNPTLYTNTPTEKSALTKISNLQHMYLDPVNSNSGVLCLPLIYPNDMMEIVRVITPLGTHDELGSLMLQSFTVLRAASSSPASEVSVQVLGWLSDVVLSGPTATTYSGMADDQFDPTPSREYTGVLSSPMSLAAKAAGKLSSIPFIGTEASLISSVLSVGADVASYFGFSRALMLDPIGYMKRMPFSSTATVIGSDTAVPLSFDPKHNVSIDPTLASEASADNLALKNFTSMWNYTNSLTWTSSQPHDTIIGHAYVFPVEAWFNEVGLALATSNRYVFTTLGYACLPFKFWSGTLEYRIRFVSSKYHTGRVKITYNPNTQPDVTEFNSEYNWIIDLAKETDIVIKIPWNQSIAYKQLQTDWSLMTDANLGNLPTYDQDLFNGWLTFSVVNELVSPYALADVDILIDKRGGDDFELFAPTSPSTENPVDTDTWYNFKPVLQTASGLADETFTELQMFGSAKTDEQQVARMSIYAGEHIPSFRTLLKRYHKCATYFVNETAGADMFRFRFIHQRILPFPGTAALGRSFTDVGSAVNYGQLSLMQFLSMGFLGQRGSIRYKYSPTVQATLLGSMRAFREYKGLDTGTRTNWSSLLTISKSNEGLFQHNLLTNGDNQGWTGTSITAGSQQRALEVDYPYYSNQRFLTNDWVSTGLVQNLFPYAADDELVCVEIYGSDDSVGTSRLCALEVWQSPGEDFSFVHWLGPPAVFSPNFIQTPAI